MQAIVVGGKNNGTMVRLTESAEQDEFLEGLHLEEMCERGKNGAFKMTEEDISFVQERLRENGHFNNPYDDEDEINNMPDYLPEGIQYEFDDLKETVGKVFTDMRDYAVDCLRHGDDLQHLLDMGVDRAFVAFLQARTGRFIEPQDISDMSERIAGFEFDD